MPKIREIRIIKYSTLLYNVLYYHQVPSSLVKSVPTLCKIASSCGTRLSPSGFTTYSWSGVNLTM